MSRDPGRRICERHRVVLRYRLQLERRLLGMVCWEYLVENDERTIAIS